MKKKAFAWVTLLPLTWLGIVTFTAGLQKIFHSNPKIGFLSQAKAYATQIASGNLPPEKLEMIKRQMFNMHLDAVVTSVFLSLVGAIILTSAWRWFVLWTGRSPLDLREEAPVWLTGKDLSPSTGTGNHWFWSLMILGMGLLKQLSGQTSFERASQTTCCITDNSTATATGAKPSKGAVWASLEEKRFKNPRCC